MKGRNNKRENADRKKDWEENREDEGGKGEEGRQGIMKYCTS